MPPIPAPPPPSATSPRHWPKPLSSVAPVLGADVEEGSVSLSWSGRLILPEVFIVHRGGDSVEGARRSGAGGWVATHRERPLTSVVVKDSKRCEPGAGCAVVAGV